VRVRVRVQLRRSTRTGSSPRAVCAEPTAGARAVEQQAARAGARDAAAVCMYDRDWPRFQAWKCGPESPAAWNVPKITKIERAEIAYPSRADAGRRGAAAGSMASRPLRRRRPFALRASRRFCCARERPPLRQFHRGHRPAQNRAFSSRFNANNDPTDSTSAPRLLPCTMYIRPRSDTARQIGSAPAHFTLLYIRPHATARHRVARPRLSCCGAPA
jgi:hypothetical protein